MTVARIALLAALSPICAIGGLLVAMVVPDDTVWGYALQALLLSALPWWMLLWPIISLILYLNHRIPRPAALISIIGLPLAGWPPLQTTDAPGADILVANVNAYTGNDSVLEAFFAEASADAVITIEKRGATIPGMLRVADNYDEKLPRPSHASAVYCRQDLAAGRCQGRVTEQIGSPGIRMPVALLRLDGVCVLGVHAPPPYPRDASGIRPYIQHIAERIEEGRLAVAWAPCQPGDPAIVAGDLNAVPRSRPLRTLRAQGLEDQQRFSGVHGLTWPSGGGWPDFPLLRLDHLLVSPTLNVTLQEHLDLPDSDHRGLWFRVSASRPSNSPR
ncbi:MAG: endonuclease/exonuclease/phosphatase family protein [Myxococcota bacterium]